MCARSPCNDKERFNRLVSLIHFVDGDAGLTLDAGETVLAKIDYTAHRTRQEILEGLDWRIYHIWSTDCVRRKAEMLAKLRGHLEKLAAEA